MSHTFRADDDNEGDLQLNSTSSKLKTSSGYRGLESCLDPLLDEDPLVFEISRSRWMSRKRSVTFGTLCMSSPA